MFLIRILQDQIIWTMVIQNHFSSIIFITNKLLEETSEPQIWSPLSFLSFESAIAK